MRKSPTVSFPLLLITVVIFFLIGAPTDPASDTALPRPPVFTSLYVSFAALQGLDVHSTLRAVANGKREANPVVGAVIDSPVRLAAMKAATAAGIVLSVEQLRKRHPRTALLLMVGLNSAYTTIVAHNYMIETR